MKKLLAEKFLEFCNSLCEKDNVAIVHHNDADGIASAAIAAKAVFALSKRNPVFVSSLNYGEFHKENNIAEELAEKAVNKLIIVDLSIDNGGNFMKKTSFVGSLLIIDHHQFQVDLNSGNTVFLNSKFFSKKPSAFPSSKLCFDMFSKTAKLGSADWIASIGIIGDNAKKAWLPFIKKAVARNKTSIAMLEKIERMISAVSVMGREKIEELFWILAKAKKPEDCMRQDFAEILEEFEKEKKSLMQKMLASEERFPKLGLVVYKMETSFPAIKSYLINDLSNKMPKKTVLVVEFFKNRARFSGRQQDGKIKVNELLAKAVEGIPKASAGGHIPAAGGSVPKKFFKKFEKQLIEELQRLKQK